MNIFVISSEIPMVFRSQEHAEAFRDKFAPDCAILKLPLLPLTAADIEAGEFWMMETRERENK
jgi:hypothetical protein